MNVLISAVVSFFLLAGCDGRGSQPAHQNPVVQPESGRLSSRERSLEFHVPVAAADARILQLTVSDVVNPARTSVEIIAVVKAASDTATLGGIALFPADIGGVFSIPVGDAARRLIADAQRSSIEPTVVIRMVNGAKPAGEVEVTVVVGPWRP